MVTACRGGLMRAPIGGSLLLDGCSVRVSPLLVARFPALLTLFDLDATLDAIVILFFAHCR